MNNEINTKVEKVCEAIYDLIDVIIKRQIEFVNLRPVASEFLDGTDYLQINFKTQKAYIVRKDGRIRDVSNAYNEFYNYYKAGQYKAIS